MLSCGAHGVDVPRLKDITSHHQDKLNVASFVDELAMSPGFAQVDFSFLFFWNICFAYFASGLSAREGGFYCFFFLG